MTRDQRKHEALRTGVARPVSFLEPLDLLFVVRPGRWSRINVAWNPAHDGRFMGWYVNFDRPVSATPDGLWSKDLVLDLMISPDGAWDWKDRAEFDRALDDRLFPPELKAVLEREAELVLAEAKRGDGPFAAELRSLRPTSTATLPRAYEVGGARWSASYPDLPLPLD